MTGTQRTGRPTDTGRWFAERVIAVKLEYGLSVDPAERDALERLLAGGGAELSCVAADTTSPTVAISSEASAPVTGPFPILVAFSEPVTGVGLEDLVVGNGSASELLQGNNATYTVTITPEASGTVTVDIAAGAAQDSAGNPSAAAAQFSITADLTPVPALPLAGAIVLALLLLIRGARQAGRSGVARYAPAGGDGRTAVAGPCGKRGQQVRRWLERRWQARRRPSEGRRHGSAFAVS